MKAGSKMTGAVLGMCFENGPRGRSRHRLLEIAYASKNASVNKCGSGFGFGFWFSFALRNMPNSPNAGRQLRASRAHRCCVAVCAASTMQAG